MDFRKMFVFTILFVILITACGGRRSSKVSKPETNINVNQGGSSSGASRDPSSDTQEGECSGWHEIILKNKTGIDLDYVAFKVSGKTVFTRMNDDTKKLPVDGEAAFLVKAGSYDVQVRICHPADAQCQDNSEWNYLNVEVCDEDVTIKVENQ